MAAAQHAFSACKSHSLLGKVSILVVTKNFMCISPIIPIVQVKELRHSKVISFA